MMNDPTRPRLLLPLQVVRPADKLLRVAADYARALGAEVVVLHVLRNGALDPTIVLPGEAEARTYLDTITAQLESAGVAACATLRCGPTAAAIVAEAHAIDATLIVLGATTRGLLPRAVLSSVADEVVHASPCPVLMVRTDEHGVPTHQPLRSFAEDAARTGGLCQRSLGLRTIEVGRIIGSVDRARELGADFRRPGPHRPDSSDEQRFQRVLTAMREGVVLPPISVYKLGFGYYVEDGHHRVAAARLIGQTDIDADVTEFLPVTDTQAERRYAARTAFERATGLTDISAARADSYPVLQQEIEDLARAQRIPELPLAARRWERCVYRPLWNDMRARQVSALFPGELTADVVARLAAWRKQTGEEDWSAALTAVVAHADSNVGLADPSPPPVASLEAWRSPRADTAIGRA
jgi:nucleotide-binding universal stress UspA family protein